jgi:hypothetical protein
MTRLPVAPGLFASNEQLTIDFLLKVAQAHSEKLQSTFNFLLAREHAHAVFEFQIQP